MCLATLGGSYVCLASLGHICLATLAQHVLCLAPLGHIIACLASLGQNVICLATLSKNFTCLASLGSNDIRLATLCQNVSSMPRFAWPKYNLASLGSKCHMPRFARHKCYVVCGLTRFARPKGPNRDGVIREKL